MTTPTSANRHRLRNTAVLAVAVCGLLGVVGCGSDNGSDASTEIGSSSSTEANNSTMSTIDDSAGSSSGVNGEEVAAHVIHVDNAWTYAIVDPNDEHVGAMFMSISGGSDDDRLIGAEVPNDIALGVALVTAVPAGNTNEESPLESDDMGNESEGPARVLETVDSFVIHAGATTEFQPGGNQLVLRDAQRAISAGESFEVTLIFEGKGPVPVMVDVR